MKRLLSILSAALILISCKPVPTLISPDGRLSVQLTPSDSCIGCVVTMDGEHLFSISDIALETDSFGFKVNLRHVSKAHSRQVLHPVVWQKSEDILDEYNSVSLHFNNGRTLEFRAFDNGVAYRWQIESNRQWKVIDEKGNYNFGGDATIWYPHEDSFYSANEQKFTRQSLSELGPGKLASLPTLFDTGSTKLLVTESDLLDYAGMWLVSDGSGTMNSIFPKYPKDLEKSGDRDEFVRSRENFIATFEGDASLPWRIVAIAREDKELLTNTLVYQLATPSKGDFSWVKPGKAQWDWWNDWNITGVDFTPGVNTETYRYYIDFAAANGIEYVVLDEGWSQKDNLLNINPDVDVPGLIAYAAEKGVRVVLWCTWLRLDSCLEEAFALFEQWGAAAAKVDFMSRDDQPMIQYYTRVAKCAAEHQLMVDFHGCCKPAGLYRTWPNVVTFEGVYGLEQSKGDQSKTIGPDHNVILPFTRMVAGPMDYTPGAVRNAHKEVWSPDYHSPQGMGTRCHHLSMFVVFESPLQMMCDAPTNYLKEPQSLDIIKQVPTVWRQTLPIDARVGEFIIVARESASGDWYLGAMTNHEGRQKQIKLDFLPEGDYLATVCSDGPDSDIDANNYTIVEQTVTCESILDIDMHSEGGFIAIIKRK